MNPAAYLFTVVIAFSCSCAAYKILLVAPLPSKSHDILTRALIKYLTNVGHEITFITPYPRKNHESQIREIDLSETQSLVHDEMFNLKSVLDEKTSLHDLSGFYTLMRSMATMTLANSDMQKIMNDPKEKFDLIIGEWMYYDLYSGLPAIFQCPFIWLSTLEPHWMILHLIDEFPNPTYTPDSMSNYVPPMSFLERVYELRSQLENIAHKFLYLSSAEKQDYEKLIVPIARKRGSNTVPDFEELRYNVSLVLGNSHLSMGQALRLPQSYKAIGGYHIDKDVKPLPQDLKNILDRTKEGVIYFSLGSNIKSSQMPEELKRDLLKMFGRLKLTVIWKFEDELPGRPSNVHIVKWAPQQSILAHPNCLLFITHGGLLSTTEAIHFGVPIIGIPVFGDQFNNVDRAVKKGFGKVVQLSYTMADDLEIAIKEIFTDPRYTAKVKELSFIYHHRPTSPASEIVHWVEHVILTKGAPHLRSPALLVPWYQKMYLDLLGLILATTAILLSIIKRLYKKWMCDKQNAKKKRL